MTSLLNQRIEELERTCNNARVVSTSADESYSNDSGVVLSSPAEKITDETTSSVETKTIRDISPNALDNKGTISIKHWPWRIVRVSK